MHRLHCLCKHLSTELYSDEKDNAGFEFPVIMERSACIACGACERVCPVLMKKKMMKTYQRLHMRHSLTIMHFDWRVPPVEFSLS